MRSSVSKRTAGAEKLQKGLQISNLTQTHSFVGCFSLVPIFCEL
jgi:hypothetical protein